MDGSTASEQYPCTIIHILLKAFRRGRDVRFPADADDYWMVIYDLWLPVTLATIITG